MIWTKIAISRLSAYEVRKASIGNIATQIEDLKAQYTSIKTTKFDDISVQGGQSNREAVLLNNIALRDELTRNRKYALAEVQMTEKGLAVLTDTELGVLNAFYINRRRNHVEILSQQLHVERSRVYEIKNEALKKFTMALYGIVEL